MVLAVSTGIPRVSGLLRILLGVLEISLTGLSPLSGLPSQIIQLSLTLPRRSPTTPNDKSLGLGLFPSSLAATKEIDLSFSPAAT